MLLRKLIKPYWYIGLLLYTLVSIAGLRSEEYFLFIAVALVSFSLFGIVISETCKWDERLYTNSNLFLITLAVSLLVVFSNHQLSLFIDGDQFVFSKMDAALYHRVATRLADANFETWGKELVNTGYGIDDWGAFIFIGLVYSILDSPTFLAIVYCVVGAITALNIFYIGRCMMLKRYAFLAALCFSISSYCLTFHSQFLKETIMVFIIIAAFRFFYGYINTRNILHLILAYTIALLIFFFRTPVALIIMLSFTITFVVRGSNNILLPLIIIVVGIILLSTTSSFMYSYDRYLAGGDVERIIDRKNSLAMGGGVINQITDPIAALFGPFPSVVAGKNNIGILNSSGLLFRMLLVLPFIYGIYAVFRHKKNKLYPLVIFFFINAIGVALTVKGLEVRLSLPHIFTVYLIAFWGMQFVDYQKIVKGYDLVGENKFILFISAVIFMSLLWNIRSFI